MGGYGISRWSDALFVAGSWELSKLRESMEEEYSCTRALWEADDKGAILECRKVYPDRDKPLGG